MDSGEVDYAAGDIDDMYVLIFFLFFQHKLLSLLESSVTS